MFNNVFSVAIYNHIVRIWEVEFKQDQGLLVFVSIIPLSHNNIWNHSRLVRLWVNAIHRELNNFTMSQVQELVEGPKRHNVIETKWTFWNKQNEARLHKWKDWTFGKPMHPWQGLRAQESCCHRHALTTSSCMKQMWRVHFKWTDQWNSI